MMTFQEFTTKYNIKYEQPVDADLSVQLASTTVKQIILEDAVLHENIYLQMFVDGGQTIDLGFAYQLLLNQLNNV